MIPIKNGPKVQIERVPGKPEIGTIIRLYHQQSFPGYGLRLEDGTEIPMRKSEVTFLEEGDPNAKNNNSRNPS
ncbi:hypothetical protein F4Z99_11540 [Candidatus Poribacteria bacterium]|nr:hypothetical protein [Candidatus Poribacteria bacterium]